jgi:hypothetical protein
LRKKESREKTHPQPIHHFPSYDPTRDEFMKNHPARCEIHDGATLQLFAARVNSSQEIVAERNELVREPGGAQESLMKQLE